MTDQPAEVSPEAAEQLRAAVDTALAKPQQAQGFLSSIPDLSQLGDVKTKVTNVLDTLIGALDTVLGYKWIIPDQYEAPLQKLADALAKVRGWVD